MKTEFNKTLKSSGMLDKFKSMLDEKKIVTYEFISVLDLNQYFSALGPLERWLNQDFNSLHLNKTVQFPISVHCE